MSDVRKDDDMRTDDDTRTEDVSTEDTRTEDVPTEDTRSEDVPTEDARSEDMRTEREMRDERSMADLRQKEADDDDEAMRTNPEIMGRAEPVAIDDRERPEPEPRPVGRAGGPGEVGATNGGMELWPDMTNFHGRFEQIQSEFIEDPKSAVQKAEQLMNEMLDHMMRSMHERMTSMHRDVEGNADTEQLRLMMRGYKEFVSTFVNHREAA